MNYWSYELFQIVILTLVVTVISTSLSSLFGIVLGLWFANYHGRLKALGTLILRTLMGLPPVVVGLVVFLLFSRNGWLGSLELLFTPTIMIIAQTIIITPIIMGLTHASLQQQQTIIKAQAKTLGATPYQQLLLLLSELRYELFCHIMTGYSRAISEVGAVMIVGGNIRYKTRMMTTAIAMLQGKGDYEAAITLGIILILLSLVIHSILHHYQQEVPHENF
jgi:tungstate transport system permease protein